MAKNYGISPPQFPQSQHPMSAQMRPGTSPQGGGGGAGGSGSLPVQAAAPAQANSQAGGMTAPLNQTLSQQQAMASALRRGPTPVPERPHIQPAMGA